ncbi:hypothetical protein F7725_020378 [Dissostichus mawsoni]|uniref:Uncharacterized protein n=1 Tax=Dissostichus mawsoni TaxID=36200 RepID=A0A7J5YD58_DISMA|nr:hypothetical protein F7725_020378 [Dissostichus mawsoni]
MRQITELTHIVPPAPFLLQPVSIHPHVRGCVLGTSGQEAALKEVRIEVANKPWLWSLLPEWLKGFTSSPEYQPQASNPFLGSRLALGGPRSLQKSPLESPLKSPLESLLDSFSSLLSSSLFKVPSRVFLEFPLKFLLQSPLESPLEFPLKSPLESLSSPSRVPSKSLSSPSRVPLKSLSSPSQVPLESLLEFPLEFPRVPLKSPLESLLEFLSIPFQVPSQVPSRVPFQVPSQVSSQVPLESLSKSLLKSLLESPLKSPLKFPLESPFKSPLEFPLKFPLEFPLKSLLKSPIKSLLESLSKSLLESPFKSPLEFPLKFPLKFPLESPLEFPLEFPLDDTHRINLAFMIPDSISPSPPPPPFHHPSHTFLPPPPSIFLSAQLRAADYTIGLAPLPQVNKINSTHRFIFSTCCHSRATSARFGHFTFCVSLYSLQLLKVTSTEPALYKTTPAVAQKQVPVKVPHYQMWEILRQQLFAGCSTCDQVISETNRLLWTGLLENDMEQQNINGAFIMNHLIKKRTCLDCAEHLQYRVTVCDLHLNSTKQLLLSK